MPSFGPVHKLIVHEVGEPYGPLSVSDFEDYEVVHPDECKEEDGYYHCGVGSNIDATGARFSLDYSGTPVTDPGEYEVMAWAETYRGFEYTEYDGGIALCAVDENPTFRAMNEHFTSVPGIGIDNDAVM